MLSIITGTLNRLDLLKHVIFYHHHVEKLKKTPDKNNQMNLSRRSINESLEMLKDKSKIIEFLKK